MATNTSDRGRDIETPARRGKASGSRKNSSAGRNALRSAASAVNPETVFDLMQRLGVTDMVMDRIRDRVNDVDVDSVFDDIGDYFRRNPEAIVVTLGAATIASGVLVYLSRRDDYHRSRDDREVDYPRHSERAPASSSASSSSSSRRRASA